MFTFERGTHGEGKNLIGWYRFETSVPHYEVDLLKPIGEWLVKKAEAFVNRSLQLILEDAEKTGSFAEDLRNQAQYTLKGNGGRKTNRSTGRPIIEPETRWPVFHSYSDVRRVLEDMFSKLGAYGDNVFAYLNTALADSEPAFFQVTGITLYIHTVPLEELNDSAFRLFAGADSVRRRRRERLRRKKKVPLPTPEDEFRKKIQDMELQARRLEASLRRITDAAKPTFMSSAQPAPRRPAYKKATPKKPVPMKPTVKKPVPKKPTAKKPVPKKPVPKKPTVKKPAAKKPVPKKPTAKKPVPKKPTVKKPVPKKPTVKKPVPKKPTAMKRAVKKITVKRPVLKKPTAMKRFVKKS